MSTPRLPSGAKPLRGGDPQWVGAYEVVGFLGEGGMGIVFLGRARDGRLVAIKVVREELARHPEFRARFRREAESAQRVPRFCTAEVLDADPEAAAPYLVTEFIDGPTLEHVVAVEGPLQRAELDQLGVAMAAALAGIHSTGVIHRDLKPSNVLLSRLGPRVIDFGIASAVDAIRLTADGQALGTPTYMAPEQLEGFPVPASDVFCWGGVMAFAATGRKPFGTGPIPDIAARIMYEQPDLAGLSGALLDIVAAAMQKDPAARPTPANLLELLGVSGTDPAQAARTIMEGHGPPAQNPAGDGTRIDLPTGLGRTLHAPPDHPAAGGQGPGSPPYVNQARTRSEAYDAGPAYGGAQGSPAGGRAQGPSAGYAAEAGPGAGGYGASEEGVSARFGPGLSGVETTWRAGRGGDPGAKRAQARRRRRIRSVLSGLVTAAILAAVVLYLLSRGSDKPLRVTDLTVKGPTATQRCNTTVDIIGTVVTNGGSGTLTYKWDLGGPAAPQGPQGDLTPKGGQKTVSVNYRWAVSNPGTAKFSATLTVEVPNEPPVSKSTTFRYSC